MIVIGVTGGVGAGKSTVLSCLQEKYHAVVIEADKVGHLVMEPGGTCYEPVLALFGEEIRNPDGSLDRRKIADRVFREEALLQKLNSLIHPAVRQWILARIEKERHSGCRFCVVEAALFLEERYGEFCQDVWYIYADREVRIQRLMQSRGYTRERAESIMRSQASDEMFEAGTDYKIMNNGDLRETYRQIDERIRDYETL
jgi:dephospho-CoA kinase